MSQKGMQAICITVFICAAVTLVACAVRTPVETISNEEIKQNLYYENIIFKKFLTSESLQNNPLVDGAIATCESTAIENLQRKSVFKIVGKDNGTLPEGRTLIVENTLIDLRIVSSAARHWGGEFAGRSHMKVHVRLTDAATGAVIHEEDLFGAPNVYGSVFSAGGSDRGLPVAMGRLISDYVSTHAVRR